MNRTALVFATAAVVGTLGLKRYPFPDSNTMLQMVLFHKPWIFHALRWGWFTMLFSTPALFFSGLFSLVFIFTASKKSAKKCELPPCLGLGDALRVVIGEVHGPRKAVEVEHPTWLSIPDRGLFTGLAIFGAIGSGKTTCCATSSAADSLLPGERSVLQEHYFIQVVKLSVHHRHYRFLHQRHGAGKIPVLRIDDE